jgi:hypothetical protein
MVYVVCGLGCVTICVEVTAMFWMSAIAQVPRWVCRIWIDRCTERGEADRQQRHHADPPNSSMHTITPPSPIC